MSYIISKRQQSSLSLIKGKSIPIRYFTSLNEAHVRVYTSILSVFAEIKSDFTLCPENQRAYCYVLD